MPRRHWARRGAPPLHPVIDWTTIIATTTVGTTLADFADRSLGIGYASETPLLFGLLMASLAIWRRTLGTDSVEPAASPRAEVFYWVTIMFSQTLGTALGDWTADSAGLGYLGGVTIFVILLPWARSSAISGQAPRLGKLRSEPLRGVGGVARLHRRLHLLVPTTGGPKGPLISVDGDKTTTKVDANITVDQSRHDPSCRLK